MLKIALLTLIVNLANVTLLTEAVGTADERATAYEYEPIFNKVTKMTDPGGFATSYTYDATGNTLTTTDAEGGVRLHSYTPEGKLETSHDENGNVTTFIYGTNKNLERTTTADGSVSEMEYDISGNVVLSREAAGAVVERVRSTVYDTMHRPIEQVDALMNSMKFGYDALGNQIRFEDAAGRVSISHFDSMNREVGGEDPMSGTSTVAYNLPETEMTVTDAEGRVDLTESDLIGRVSRMTEPHGVTRENTYDEVDQLATMIDGKGGVTSFQYDILNRSIWQQNPEGEIVTTEYDLRDNVTKVIAANGDQVTFAYDGNRRVTGMTTPDNGYTYSYDPVGNVTLISDSDTSISMTYDLMNRVATETVTYTNLPAPVTLTYEYDALSRRIRTTDSYGGVIEYTYDAENRQTRVTQPWGGAIDFTFDVDGRSRTKTYTNGTLTEVDYDIGGRLGSLKHSFNTAVFHDQRFGYDAAGRMVELRDGIDLAQTRTLLHDLGRRLIGVNTGIPVSEGGVPIPVEDYAYDAEDNRTASHLTSAYVYDTNHRLLETAAHSYSYDANGNRTSRTDKGTGEVVSYGWDAQDQLISVASSLGWSETYRYDAQQRRIGRVRTDGGVVREQAFVYDGPNVLFVFTTEGGVTTSRRWMNAYGLDKRYGFEDYASGVPTAGTGSIYEVHQDYLGSVVAVVDAVAGAVVSSYRYDSFGQRTVISEAVDSGYGFTGHQYDAETGLGYFRMRYYDPGEGRFLTTDPLGFPDGPMNAYAYVANAPYQSTDPSGLSGSAPWSKITLDAQLNAQERPPLLYGVVTNLILAALNKAMDELFFPSPVLEKSFPGFGLGGSNWVEDANRGSACHPINRPARNILPIDTRTHGGAAHDAAINRRWKFLVGLNIYKYKIPAYNGITKDQNQKDMGGLAVSTCRPDLQYNYFAAHYLEEYMSFSDPLQTFNKMLVMNRADPMAAQVLYRVGRTGGRK